MLLFYYKQFFIKSQWFFEKSWNYPLDKEFFCAILFSRRAKERLRALSYPKRRNNLSRLFTSGKESFL